MYFKSNDRNVDNQIKKKYIENVTLLIILIS